MGMVTDGWPVAEGIVMLPACPGQWPLATQIVMLPFESQRDPVDVDVLQVVVVPRAEWERVSAAAAKAGA